MNRLLHKLILLFLAATLLPLGAVLWMSTLLLEHSLSYVATDDLDRLSRSLEVISREFYRQARENLREEAASGRLEAERLDAGDSANWPGPLRQFWESGDAERFVLSEPDGDRLNYLVRRDEGIRLYSRDLNGVRMAELTDQYRQARARVEQLRGRDIRRGFAYTLALLSALIWLLSLAGVVYMANRISRPIEGLTAGLHQLAAGSFETRLRSVRRDEVGRAIEAFNHTAEHLQQSRDRLVYLAQVASWQALARKMAHELKNSLTPIRLTVEEIAARRSEDDRPFFEQAARVVVDEVESLERRVRAFSEFAAEPPARPSALDLNALLEERVQFLRGSHPEVVYRVRPGGDIPPAWADVDQVKGILTNLLQNAAEAAAGGTVLGLTGTRRGNVLVEIHDSGPGLSAEARASLFEPSISFKEKGMGLGLSISRKNALLAGGDLLSIDGQLGGAGFRLLLPSAPSPTGDLNNAPEKDPHRG